MSQPTTQAAADIRAAYKRNGWSSRQISVRADCYSMGSSIDIALKDGSIPLHKVKAIAQGKERIDRCEMTGEILNGGNRYVHVTLTDEARELKARRYIEAVERAIALLNDPSDGVLQPIIKGYYVGRGDCQEFALWGDLHIAQCRDAESVAYSLAVKVEEGPKY